MNEANLLMLSMQKKVLVHSLRRGDVVRLRELFDSHLRSVSRLRQHVERLNIDELSDEALIQVVTQYLDDSLL